MTNEELKVIEQLEQKFQFRKKIRSVREILTDEINRANLNELESRWAWRMLANAFLCEDAEILKKVTSSDSEKLLDATGVDSSGRR